MKGVANKKTILPSVVIKERDPSYVQSKAKVSKSKGKDKIDPHFPSDKDEEDEL